MDNGVIEVTDVYKVQQKQLLFFWHLPSIKTKYYPYEVTVKHNTFKNLEDAEDMLRIIIASYKEPEVVKKIALNN